MKLLEYDETFINIIYLACNRDAVSEGLAMVPGNEMKSYEELLHYRSRYKPEIDIGWSDAFLGASAWLSDRERTRRDNEKRDAGKTTGNLNSGNFTSTL